MLLLGGAVVLSALVAGAVWFALAFDPNAWRDDVESLFADVTGRTLVIRGDLGLTFIPWLGAEARDVRVEDGDGGQPFATAERAGVSVRLWPLLVHGRIDAGGVHVEGLVLELRRRASGSSNWSDLVERLRQPHSSSTRPGTSIAGVDVRDARVHYVDEGTGREIDVRDAWARLGRYTPGKPIDVEAGFAFERNGLAAGIRFRGRGRETRGAFTVEAPRVEIKTAPGGHLQADGSLAAAAWTLDGAGALTVDHPVLELTLAGDAVHGRPVMLRAEAPALTASLAAQSASIAEMKAEMDGVVVRGSMTGTSVFADPELAGRIELQTFSPKAVMEKLGMTALSTADAAALTRAQATARYVVRGGGLELDELALTLDDTRITGTVAVRDFASAAGSLKTGSNPAPKAKGNDASTAPDADGADPALRFDLGADRLELDRYLPPVVKGGRAAGGAADPLVRLRAALAGLDAEGTLRVGTLEIGDLRSTDAVLGFHAALGAADAAAEQ